MDVIFHSAVPHPHQGACGACLEDQLCNYCGKKATKATRCTNGRCPQCHASVCTPGGTISDGHGFGKVGSDWRKRADEHKAKDFAQLEEIKIANAIRKLSDEHGLPNGFFLWEIQQHTRCKRIRIAGILARPSQNFKDAMRDVGLEWEYEKRIDTDNPARISVRQIE